MHASGATIQPTACRCVQCRRGLAQSALGNGLSSTWISLSVRRGRRNHLRRRQWLLSMMRPWAWVALAVLLLQQLGLGPWLASSMTEVWTLKVECWLVKVTATVAIVAATAGTRVMSQQTLESRRAFRESA